MQKKSLEEKRIYTAEFMQDYVFYNDVFEPFDTLKPMSLKQEHMIVISNISDPSNIQVQLSEHVPIINKLMDDLETLYCGIGSSNYDMPMSYVQMSKLCAAIYPGDNNWHRCRITGIFVESNQARVAYLDYGGEGNVSI